MRPGRQIEEDSVRVLNLLNSDHRRGAEAFGVDLGHALLTQGESVTTVALAASGQRHTFDVESLGRGRFSMATGLWNLRAAAGKHDVLVGHGGRTLFAGATVRAVTRTPFVYRVIGEPRFWAARTDQRLRVRASMRAAARVAVYYRSVADDLTAMFGVDPARLVVIPKGVAADRFAPADDQQVSRARRHFGVEGSGPVIVYVGALSVPKNVEQIIAAAGRVSGARLLLVGDGPDRGRLEQKAASSGGEVRFVGVSDRPEDALRAADVVALTSRSEGMPSVVIEAGLAERPVVATPVGGVAELVRNGETGLLVPLDDVDATTEALEQALERRVEIGAAARRWCLDEFDLDAVAGRWSALLHQVCAARRA